MKIGSLCSGYGGLDSAVISVLGGELAWTADNSPGASLVLAHHYPTVKNLGDITLLDWNQVEPVDVLVAGFPCTDVSTSGKRAGIQPGNRSGLWIHIASAIATLRPPLVIIENVRGLLSARASRGDNVEFCSCCMGDRPDRVLRAAGAVLGDLSTLGYDSRWHTIPASSAGAPHQRDRVFIWARPAVHTKNSNGIQPPNPERD